MTAGPALAPDAAMVLGIASTAMPFARTPEEQAERWLRVLRQHGEVGLALEALGVSDAPLSAPDERVEDENMATRADERDVLERVNDQACRIATERGADAVATTDLLLAVMHVYGPDFDRVLQTHGTTSDELIERLAAGTVGPADA
jgi:hypothetical protein